jgi:diaminobutyrate-2-oxoglutarate transaminase
VFDRALGSRLYDERGREYLDFFAGAGALNYGHNNPVLKQPLMEYLAADRIVHSLDMFTVAKREFLETFDELIIRPRGLTYRVQFPGPGGANAVEAALKLARKLTGGTEVLHFTNSFHGMTLGALAVTGSAMHRKASGMTLGHAMPLPYDHALDDRAPDFAWFDRLLKDSGSGLDRPAGVIIEAVQGEGGVNIARPEWLRGLAQRCADHGLPLILDDVQMGCGRTGPFFSFESADIRPDIVCLSKSISGYGLPVALTLIREDLDIWEPGEHNGTFRGVSPALVTATAAIQHFWREDALERTSLARGDRIAERLRALAASVTSTTVTTRGIGMVHGLAFDEAELAQQVASGAFSRGLLVETAGPEGEVVKLLPALTIPEDELDEGLAILADAVHSVC